MNVIRVLFKEQVQVECTVEVENTFDSLHAHVTLPDAIQIKPGDEVIVHGEPIRVPYGERFFARRTATVIHASLLEQFWTRITGDLEFMELCEFSFSGEHKP